MSCTASSNRGCRKSAWPRSIGTGLLADAGEIKRIELAGRQSRYDGDTSIHYHLRCRKCGAVEDLHIDRSKSLNRDLEGMLSGRISDVKVEFDGYCIPCYTEMLK